MTLALDENMSLIGFDELFAQADRLQPHVPVAVAGGADPTVLQALTEAAHRGWVRPIVCGSANAIQDEASRLEVDLSTFEVIDTEAPAKSAVEQVRHGRAKLLMKGQVATPDLMKAVLSRDTGLRTGQTICQVVLMEIPRDNRRFLLADTGITINPTVEQASEIVDAVVATAAGLGVKRPRVAIMAATEKANDAMPETELARRLVELRGLSDCVIQGPLSFDLAYSSDAGSKKQLSGEAIGAADAMVFPNLLSANLTVKAIMYTADCRFGGVLRGVACPVVFMSRADDTITRMRSLAFALSQTEAM